MTLGEIARAYVTARRIDKASAAAVWHAPTIPHLAVALAVHDLAHSIMVRARRRLALSTLAYVATAVIIVGVLYGLIVLMWLAFGTAPVPEVSPMQLPTV